MDTSIIDIKRLQTLPRYMPGCVAYGGIIFIPFISKFIAVLHKLSSLSTKDRTRHPHGYD
ncbi:uncharacterized protein PHALS_15058 [Plasmopara halstedii]|uniref:Uncharacterized protein n=1 Tax=Plasmopara halstedii TaxID=4781 RepID=A0A0P1AZ97_PLAHL|nr:uncharacterized protein PHALS_15058 [Plasmopara halstedii]CEG47738.1 hypothetical protein PHALS_15058 [Plasmopara halstedii]|eukprot:XP_024584107.1 hypothetical protein PHALS_15058 [Plasmopara halstedii]